MFVSGVNYRSYKNFINVEINIQWQNLMWWFWVEDFQAPKQL